MPENTLFSPYAFLTLSLLPCIFTIKAGSPGVDQMPEPALIRILVSTARTTSPDHMPVPGAVRDQRFLPPGSRCK